MDLEREILKQFKLWNAALQSGDADKVVSLYATDAILLPTLSNQIRHNHAEIRDYFEHHFLPKKPRGRIDAANVRIKGGIALNSGAYTFRFGAASGGKAHARFTFVYEWRDGRWQIIEHHSSAMPEPVVGKPVAAKGKRRKRKS